MGLEIQNTNATTPSLLTGSKAERKAAKQNLEKQYLQEGLKYGMSKKDAERYAKNMVKNAKAQERVDRTVTYYTKDEARAARKAAPKEERQFIQGLSKRDRKVVDRNSEDFMTNGQLDNAKSKEFVLGWSGKDYRVNDGSDLERPEDHVMAGYLDTNDTRAKHIARKFGYETGNLFWKRAAHVATFGAVGAGAGAGAAQKSKQTARFVSEAVVDHNGNVIVDEIEDIIKTGLNTGKAITAGAVLGALGGLATIDAVGGNKDLFGGREPRAIIESGNVKGVDKSIQPLMIAVIADQKLTNDQKAELIERAIGKNSSSLCDEREFAALYHDIIAKGQEPQVQNQGEQQQVQTQGEQQQVQTQGEQQQVQTQGEEQQVQTEGEEQQQVQTQGEEQQVEEPQVQQQEPQKPEPCEVIVQNGESLSRLAKKYGVSVKEIIELNKSKLRKFKHATNCDSKKSILGFRVGETILIPGGCEKAEGNKSAKEAKKEYNEMVRKNIDKYCPDAGVYTDKFASKVYAERAKKESEAAKRKPCEVKDWFGKAA